jgi:hypothetical protein
MKVGVPKLELTINTVSIFKDESLQASVSIHYLMHCLSLTSVHYSQNSRTMDD